MANKTIVGSQHFTVPKSEFIVSSFQTATDLYICKIGSKEENVKIGTTNANEPTKIKGCNSQVELYFDTEETFDIVYESN